MQGDDDKDAKTSVMASLIGREGDNAQGAYRRVTAYAKAKGYADNSEMYQWADMLGYSFAILDDVPGKVKTVGMEVVRSLETSTSTLLRDAAELTAQHRATLKAQAEQTQVDLVAKSQKALLDSVTKIASDQARSNFTRGVVAAAVAVVLFGAVCGLGGWYVANQHYIATLAETTGVSDPAQATAAFKLAKLGQAKGLLACSQKGWRLMKKTETAPDTYCMPYAADGMQNGWLVDLKQ